MERLELRDAALEALARALAQSLPCTDRVSVSVLQIIFSGPPLFTWCAFDTMLFPALLGRSAEVRSRCHATGVLIRCSVGLDGLEALVPAAAVISLVAPGQGDAPREPGGGFYRQAHFFASPAAAGRWWGAHATAHLLPVAQAHVLARRISALRGGTA